MALSAREVSRCEPAARLDVFAVLVLAAHFVLGPLGCGRTTLDRAAAAPSQEMDSGTGRDTSGPDATLDLVLLRDAPRNPFATADAETIPDVPMANDVAVFQDTSSGPDATLDLALLRDAPRNPFASVDAAAIFDGPEANDDSGFTNMCSMNATVLPPDVPGHGTFTGPNVDVLVCEGGIIVQHFGTTHFTTPYVQWFENNIDVAASGSFSVRKPQNVQGAGFTALLEMNSNAAGTYTSAETCGNVIVCFYFPIPAGLDCSTDAGFECPPGCELVGPSFDLTCMPMQPEICYSAQGSSNCDETQDPVGSWQLTLTSISPAPVLSGSVSWYLSHGSLTATMVSDHDASDTVSLSLGF